MFLRYPVHVNENIKMPLALEILMEKQDTYLLNK